MLHVAHGGDREVPFSERREIEKWAAVGQGNLPQAFIKGKICERFGWTFAEYDDTDADELLRYLTLSRAADEVREALDMSNV